LDPIFDFGFVILDWRLREPWLSGDRPRFASAQSKIKNQKSKIPAGRLQRGPVKDFS
jgi:hypothetical protein